MSIVEKFISIFGRKPKINNLPISLSADGFNIKGTNIQWNEVTEITAYKIDLITTDSVRIRLNLSSQTLVVLDEDQPGFEAFVSKLEELFPSVKGWQSKVIQPAFARNETQLYRRA